MIALASDARPSMPVVYIEGINNGLLYGTVSSGARLFIGEEFVLPNASGAFQIPADVFMVNNVTVKIPEGMYFVASRKGKKYYPVVSAAAYRLSPQNRVYFRTEEEVRAAGYVQ